MIWKSDWTLGAIRVRTLVTESYSSTRGQLKAAGFFVVTILHKELELSLSHYFLAIYKALIFFFIHTKIGCGLMELFIYCLSIPVKVWPIRMCLSYRTSVEPPNAPQIFVKYMTNELEVILDTVTKAVRYYGKHNDSRTVYRNFNLNPWFSSKLLSYS